MPDVTLGERVYEVERRTPGHLEVPPGFVHSKTLDEIKDYYFKIDPQVRLRYSKISFPQDGVSYRFTSKRKEGGEVVEFESSMGSFEAVKNGLYALANPVVVISGSRRVFYNEERDMSLHLDEVDGLGKWTELEKLVGDAHSKDLVALELEELMRTIDPNIKIERRTYVEMKLENLIINHILQSEIPPTIETLARTFQCDPSRISAICNYACEQSHRIKKIGDEFWPD
ncbi:MAG: hypothetical protein QW548_00055 [Candidatus Aenigmatarchaeota archaeon]